MMTAETAPSSRRAGRPGLFASPPPAAALEIARDRVAAVAISESGGSPQVTGYAVEPLATGIIDPVLNGPNVLDQGRLASAIQSVLDKLGSRSRRMALILPDTIAKVSLLRFEKVPSKVQDLEQLIRWQVRKAAPFKIEDAQVSWIGGVELPGGGREFIVTMARRDLIQSYEAACEAAGVHAGLVDLATFNVVNAVLAAREQLSGDWLLVHIAADYVTLAVVRGGDLVFFRNRALATEAELTDLVHQTAMYQEDRLGGGGFSSVVLAGGSVQGVDVADRLRRAIEDRLRVKVSALDFRAAASLRDRISANPALLDALAPGVGVLVRDRRRSATGRVA
jgi:type IV pilus assembly protein PilM